MKNCTDHLSVSSQLAGKRVLITGTTGFLAKVLLEKLVRDVPEIKQFILVIRANKTYSTAAERFEREILSSSIFDRLREEQPQYLDEIVRHKFVFVTGEVTEPLFGLTPIEFAKLANGVDIVVSSAASVNFREELDQALDINALSLLKLTALTRMAGHIPLIHVSTCYVNGYNEGKIPEQLMESASKLIPIQPAGYYEVKPLIDDLLLKIEAVKRNCLSVDELPKALTDLGIREANRYGWNDTYTFTKWIGEQIVCRELQGKSLTIVRPSIIESTLREPTPGWIEGVKVGDALILAYARGKTNFFPAKTDEIVDLIPADLVANSIILSMTEALAHPGQRRIYQCCSGSSNPIILGNLIDIIQTASKRDWRAYDKLFYNKPGKDFRCVSRPSFLATMSVLKLALGAVSWARKCVGMNPSFTMLESFNTTHNLAVVFSFYTSPSYTFQNKQLQELENRMGEFDRRMFSIDPRLINWKNYMGNIHLAGLNRFALKDKRRNKTTASTLAQDTANAAPANLR
ncbi:MAG: fatty acyl-CoA reductase [Undibacterium sp.]|uniref:fatty acyl-CoA reductase n=1 Tax=Undibacterium sp. TaxID=1914977 RepID=UPI0027191D32|nr:fatty acyl-CoA reductase [Undibacterium sp.]MDO8654801.1 fatty acyl-CoA reductase [Undibacterium sp.]